MVYRDERWRVYKGNPLKMASQTTFNGMVAYVHEAGLGKARTSILKKQFISQGGATCDRIDDTVTHIFAGNKLTRDKLLKTLRLEMIPEGIAVLSADWLSNCLTHGELVSMHPYYIPASTPKASPQKMSSAGSHASPSPMTKEETTDEQETAFPSSGKRESTSTSMEPKKMKYTSPLRPSPRKVQHVVDSDSDYVDSAEEEEKGMLGDEHVVLDSDSSGGRELPSTSKAAFTKKGMFVCEMPSTLQAENKNKIITDKLEELLKSYENNGDQWRVYTYTKVIQVLKKHPKTVSSWEEAKSLPFVGERLADKIWEIAQSGHLRRLDHVDEKEKLVETFKKIWGVGATSARRFVQMGYKTLEDLGRSGILTRVQEIGLRHYEDFNERIPRSEVKEIEEKVRELAHSINSGLDCTTCGSYRRGKETCGDVDILITHPDGRSHRGVFQEILKRGHETGVFLSISPRHVLRFTDVYSGTSK
jgi:DNA polymerase lambda